MDVASLYQRLGYEFRDPSLLRAALTHRSHGALHNERLEFLGDSVLGLSMALELFERFPASREGDLSRLRASLVNKQMLFEIAQSMRLGDLLRLGEGELKSGGFRRPSILADALEAILGAVLVDGGFVAARAVIARLFAQRLDALDPHSVDKDPKTRLQEWLQSRRLALPRYELLAVMGQAHEQTFRVLCAIAERDIATEGEGPNRRAAEMIAAERAYELVQNE